MAMNKFRYEDSEYPCLAIISRENDEPNWKRDEAWGAKTPMIYRHTELARLPCPEATAKALALCEDTSVFGVLAWGPSGAGKSRVARLIARKAMDLTGSDRFTAITGRELRDKVTSLGRTGGVTEWIRSTVDETDVLLIDDIGHGTASDSYLSAMLELIEAATSDFCYLIVTSNFSGRDLKAHWARSAPDSIETAAAIVRRLAEFCHQVRFAKPSPAAARTAQTREPSAKTPSATD